MAEFAPPPAPDAPAETPAARRARMLAKVADAALELACDLQQAALAAAEPQEKVRFALGFHHVSRTMRQSLALEARFEREAARDAHEAATREQVRATQATAVRKTQVQAGVERLIWTELEPEEAETWTADLAERLDDEALDPAFTDETVDDHIARAARELGLTGAERHEYIPRARRRGGYDRHARWRALVDAMDFDDEDEDDDDDDEDEDEAAPESPPPPPPRPALAPPPPRPPPAPPPIILAPAEPPPEPPKPPDPPPEPPPPDPYIPPWDRLAPGSIFPGGSGY